MKRQRGQSMVEFALMAPIVFMMIFGMIYGGIMFMQYMHYSNAVRTAAREIAVSATDDRETTRKQKEDWLTSLWEEELAIKFYKPKVTIPPIEPDDVDVMVTVELVIPKEIYATLPNILRDLQFPPQTIKALQYRMKLEQSTTGTG
ncbi:MAG: pilus assembly protein [Selenomonadaceae bacterium]|nr:pilus assembly protein [Selenomonadaceae bacterium]